MADSLPSSLIQGISISNVASVAEQPAVLSNLALGNVIANVNQAQENGVSGQQAMNQLQMTVLAKLVNQLTTAGPTQAAAARSMFEGGSQTELLVTLLAALMKKK